MSSYTAHTFAIPEEHADPVMITFWICQDCHAVVLPEESQAHSVWHAREVFR